MKSKRFMQYMQKGLYVSVVIFLAFYICTLGIDPWKHILLHKDLFFLVMIISGVAIFIQAKSFSSVLPVTSPVLKKINLVGIWSFSAMISVIAPVVAGLATRTTLLVRAGIPVKTCITTSLRQMWMGFECAFCVGGLASLFWNNNQSVVVAFSFLAIGLLMMAMRVGKKQHFWKIPYIRWFKQFDFLQEKVTLRAYLWFIFQLMAMSLTYLVIFNGFGAHLSIEGSLILSSFTVLSSLIIIIPNGLGVLDAIWVMVASSGGLDVRQSAALAIVMRLSNLVAAILITVSSWMFRDRTGKNEF